MTTKHTFRQYLRLISFVRPYWFYLTLSIGAAAGFAALSSAGVWMVVPFVSGVFGRQTIALDVGRPGEEPAGQTTGDSAMQPAGGSAGELTRIKSAIKQRINALFLGQGTSQKDALRRLCGMVFLAFLLRTGFAYAQRVTITCVEQYVARDVRDRLYAQLQRLSLDFYHNRRTGDLISRVTSDVGALNNAISVSFIGLLRDPIMIVFCLGTMVILSVKLTITSIIILPACATVVVRLGRRIKRYSLRSQVGMAGLTSILQETISGARLVKAYTMEDREVTRFGKETERLRRTLVKLAAVRRISSPVTEMLVAIAGVGILWVGGNEVLGGGLMTPDDFLAFLGAMFLMVAPIRNLSDAAGSIQTGLGASERIFEILDEKPTIVEAQGAVVIRGVTEGIDFSHVSFRYRNGEVVLKDIDLHVAAGEIVALVGPSGAGKTTLLDLVPRFYDPTEGRVEIDGIDIRTLSIRSLRSLIGIVSQETILFNDTVSANIAYGADGATRADVESAARASWAHDFISTMDQGYETVIGDRGATLSGGQRQRIAIARAILRDPKVLILDEATSSLDAESEMAVQKALDQLMVGRTVFVIAHRLSTVRGADRIVVIDGGRIVQTGSHETLVREAGLYQNLYTLQFSEG